MDWGSCTDSRRQMRVAWRSGLEGTWVPAVHAVCPHNEVSALLTRSLGPVPPPVFDPVGEDVAKAFSRLASIARAYRGERWSHLETAQSYSGSLRRRYLEAERSLRVDGLSTSDDYHLRPFLKAEKLNASSKHPKPRLIFPRSPRYNLEVASRLKPFEHWLWGYLTARRLFNGTPTRVVAKGLSPRQRANLIVRKFRSFRKCVCFEVDGAAFEAHVGPDQLRREQHVYRTAYPRDGRLRWLLAAQMVLRGRLACGAKFSRKGGRASGDFNTGMGNTLVMLAVVVGTLRSFRVEFDVLVDGDNALVFLHGCDADRVVRDFGHIALSQSGQELVLERCTSVIEEIRFGRSAPIYLGPFLGWSMVRDWRSVLSGALCSHRWLREPVFAREWMVGVLRCELSLALGVPVLQAWALNSLRRMGFRGAVRAHPHSDYLVVGAWFADERMARPVSPECRASFHAAFGCPPEEQLRLEASLGCVAPLEYTEVDLSRGLDCDPGLVETWWDHILI